MVAIWNYSHENVDFDPFSDSRKQLRRQPEIRKRSSNTLSKNDNIKMAKLWNWDEPEGLQKRFFRSVFFGLAWTGGEGLHCITDYFKHEKTIKGELTR